MELASSPKPGLDRRPAGPVDVAVIDSFPMKESVPLGRPAGVVVVLDGFPSDDPESFVGREAIIQAAPGRAISAWIAGARDHRVTISFFFAGLGREDVPIGSTITVVD